MTILNNPPAPTQTTHPVRARVLIVQAVIPHYRLKLFELLYQRLLQDGIELQVIYGNPNKEQASKHDLVDLPWPIGLKVKNYWLFGDRLLYQPVLKRLLSVEMAIILNGNRNLIHTPLSVAALFKGPKLGFWVFHRNSQIAERSLKESMRKLMMQTGQWWFAYTATSRNYLLSNDIPDEQITVLNNSVDVSGFRSALEAIKPGELHEFAGRHNIPADSPIGLFCGGLHREKRLEFLLNAVQLIHADYPNFQFIVLGDGVMREQVLLAAAKDSRIHYLGASFAKEKALCFQLSQVFLCPGIVGLAILDAFAAGLPMITTDIPNHSPEIAYLNQSVNGLMTADDPRAYADAVISIFESKPRLRAMRDSAFDSARQYSIENMAERFADGIISCLNQE